MKTRRTLAVGIALLTSTLPVARAADDGSKLPELNAAVTPDSPAFVQLGVSPTQIQRPTDPKSFAAAVVPAIVSKDGFGIPPGFALEAAPYWWASHPNLRYEDYLDGGLSNFFRNMSISIASTTAASATSSSATSSSSASSKPSTPPQVAFGLRTTLWRGAPDRKAAEACVSELQPWVDAYQNAYNAELLKGMQAHPQSPAPTEEDRKHAVAAGTAASDKATKSFRDCSAKAFSIQRGFAVDMAGAISVAIPNNQFESSKLYGASGWLTAAFLPSASDSLMLVARYLSTAIGESTAQRTVDVGGRYSYAWSKFGLSLEALYRDYLKGDPGGKGYAVRATGSLDMAVGGDTWVTLTVGRDYAPLDTHPFLSLAGLKWNVDTSGARTINAADLSKLTKVAGASAGGGAASGSSGK